MTPFSILTSKIFAGLAALFFLGFVTQTIRIEGFWFIVGFKEENEILRLDLSKIKAASLIAEQAAKDRVERDRANFERLAERTDNAEHEIARLRSAADAYARAHRVRGKAADRSSGKSGGAGEGDAAQGGDGPGDDAGVVVSKPDFDALVTNTIRLKQVREWGESLIVAGLATEAAGDK